MHCQKAAQSLRTLAMSSSGIGLLILAVVAGWFVTILVGSLIALRGKVNWPTIILVIGSGLMCLGGIGYFGGAAYFFSSMYRSATGYGTGRPEVYEVIMVVALIVFGLGLILFTAGFLGVAGRYGMAERRAAQLEGMVLQLQQRMQGGG